MDLHADIPIVLGEEAPRGDAGCGGAERSLVDGAKAGCEDSFRRLVEQHQDAIYRFCFHWLHDSEDAREAAQDTFLRAWKAIERYQPKAKIRNWLYRIALNVCRDRHRSKAARQRRSTHPLDEETSPLPCHRLAPDETLMQAADLEKLQRGIHALPPRLRAVLILCLQEGLPQETCGEILGCSSRAVEGRLYRARRTLIEWWHRHD